MSISKSLLPFVIGILIGLVFSGLLLIVIRSPQGEPIMLAPSPTKAPVTVHLSGAVVSPGVYELPEGSRAKDLIAAAGGFTEDADTDSLNLAAPLIDGTRVHVYNRTGESEDLVVEPRLASTSEGLPVKVNINTASVKELEQLPGIGPAKAQQIVDYRTFQGRFVVIEDIMNVPGIGETLFKQIADLIVVN